jgi:hypothetical protein
MLPGYNAENLRREAKLIYSISKYSKIFKRICIIRAMLGNE